MLDTKGSNGKSYPPDQLRDLWHEVASFPVCHTELAVHTFLTRLSEMVGAHSATWLALKKQEASPKNIPADYHDLIHEGLNGWMSIAAVYTNKQKNLKAVMDRWFVRAQREGADDYTRAICANSGSTRAILRRDIVSDEDWENDWFRRDFLHYFGVSDRLSSVVTLNDECEACIFLDRPLDAEPFTESEKNLIYLASAGTAELHKRMFLEHGAMVASSPLSKRERETYRYLLTEMSESQIADHMKLSAHTVHDYARGLYKKFGVKGRLGLMALVLGR